MSESRGSIRELRCRHQASRTSTPDRKSVLRNIPRGMWHNAMFRSTALFRTALVLALLMWTLSASVAQISKPRITLVGIWQDSSEIGSGWSDTYQFFDDGHFVFHYNQMDCASREASYAGHWELEGTSILLSVEQRKLWVGGHFEHSKGSCGTEMELIGAKAKTVEIKPPKRLTLRISAFESMPATDDSSEPKKGMTHRLPRISIDGVKYWKLRDNPDDF
jgi:hypothetical protein